MYRRKEGKMKVTNGAHTGLILTLPLCKTHIHDAHIDLHIQPVHS